MDTSKSKFTNQKMPVGDDWHPADIVAAIHKTGWSMRQLSLHHGCSTGVVKTALRMQYPRAERIIADAIGVEPWEIWPSRYGADHQPLRVFRRSSNKNSSTARRPHGNSQAVA